eukprot:1159305-Pelagomonas_calceolata.AAC.2
MAKNANGSLGCFEFVQQFMVHEWQLLTRERSTPVAHAYSSVLWPPPHKSPAWPSSFSLQVTSLFVLLVSHQPGPLSCASAALTASLQVTSLALLLAFVLKPSAAGAASSIGNGGGSSEGHSIVWFGVVLSRHLSALLTAFHAGKYFGCVLKSKPSCGLGQC